MTSTNTIPSTLEEALDVLDTMLDDEERKYLLSTTSDDAMAEYHHGFGRWMRNEWSLWNGGPLKEHLEGLGLQHADDMSGLILTSFWRRLHGQPLYVEDQVRFYQEYWSKVRP